MHPQRGQVSLMDRRLLGPSLELILSHAKNAAQVPQKKRAKYLCDVCSLEAVKYMVNPSNKIQAIWSGVWKAEGRG